LLLMKDLLFQVGWRLAPQIRSPSLSLSHPLSLPDSLWISLDPVLVMLSMHLVHSDVSESNAQASWRIVSNCPAFWTLLPFASVLLDPIRRFQSCGCAPRRRLRICTVFWNTGSS
jgi:hypothetical protein